MLRLFKQLDITRARLQAKITAKVHFLNNSYRRPLSSQDKQNIARNLSLLPLALGVQLKEAVPTAQVTKMPSAKKSSRLKTTLPPPPAAAASSLSPATALKQESVHFNAIKKTLSKSMDHESTYYRWIEKAVNEEEEHTKLNHKSSKQSVQPTAAAAAAAAGTETVGVVVLSKEISQSVEMLAQLAHHHTTLKSNGGKLVLFRRLRILHSWDNTIGF